MKAFLSVPAVLVVSSTWVACAPAQRADAATDAAHADGGSTVADGADGELECVVVIDQSAAVQPTFRCRDGRTCSEVRPEQGDGGVYQICPGTNGCALLVMSNGQSMVGFC